MDEDFSILATEVPNSSSFNPVNQDASQNHYFSNKTTCKPSDNAPLSKNENIAEQATNSYCRAATLYIGAPQSELHTDSPGILDQKSPLDESTRIDVTVSLLRRIL